jgi:membrane protein implicated in regulation of membrane protease activity
MRGRTYRATNWILVGLLLIAWQYIILNYLIPLSIGLSLVDEGNSLILALSTVLALLLAYVSAYFIKRTFTRDGIAMAKWRA